MPDYPEDEPSESAKVIADNWMAKAGFCVGNWNNDMTRKVYFRGHLIEYTPAELENLRRKFYDIKIKKLGGSEK